MQGIQVCLLFLASSVYAQPLFKEFQARQTTGLFGPPDTTSDVTVFPTTPDRSAAYDIENNNVDQLIQSSKAAAAAGGAPGIAKMWDGYIPSGGNPFAIYYANNPSGSASKAKANGYGNNAPATIPVTLPPKAAPANDQTADLLSIATQVGNGA